MNGDATTLARTIRFGIDHHEVGTLLGEGFYRIEPEFSGGTLHVFLNECTEE